MDNNKISHLFDAIRIRDFKTVKQMVENLEYCPDTDDVRTENNDTPLMIATHYVAEDIVQYLIDKNVNLDAQNDDGETALMRAVGSTFDIFKQLFEKGADTLITDNDGNTVFSLAVKNQNTDVIRYLIQEGAVIIKNPYDAPEISKKKIQEKIDNLTPEEIINLPNSNPNMIYKMVTLGIIADIFKKLSIENQKTMYKNTQAQLQSDKEVHEQVRNILRETWKNRGGL